MAEKIRQVEGKKIVSKGLSECGYDLEFGPYVKTPKSPAMGAFHQLLARFGIKSFVIDPHDDTLWHRIELKGKDYIDIPPNSFIIGHSQDYIKMPLDHMGICLGKSTYARDGKIANMTPLEPGWMGYLTIEIGNLTRYYNRLYINQGVCQVIFIPLVEKVSKGYNGKYQSQGYQPFKSAV